MANRDYLEQFFYGFDESFISNPSLLMFMVVVFIVLFKKIDRKLIKKVTKFIEDIL